MQLQLGEHGNSGLCHTPYKSGDGEHDRSGQPDKNSWDSLGKVDPHREEPLLGRTAHSARNEETIHERTGKPASENVQGKADFENFIMGSETTEFVNKVRNQVRIRQRRMSSIAENCTEHSIILGMFMATTVGVYSTLSHSPRTLHQSVPCSPQQQQQRAGALTLSSSCLDGSVTPVGPGLNPQYTGVPKAGGGCGLLDKSTTTSPMAQPQCSKKQCINVNMVAEQFRSTAR